MIMHITVHYSLKLNMKAVCSADVYTYKGYNHTIQRHHTIERFT